MSSSDGDNEERRIEERRKGERRKRKAARSGIQSLLVNEPTLATKLLRLNAKAAQLDVADLLELYFSLFVDLDPDGFWAVHLLGKRHIALQRASSRMPQTPVLHVTRRAWSEAGLSDEERHPSVELVERYKPHERDGLQAVLIGEHVLGVISYEPSTYDKARRSDLQMIAATLAPHLAHLNQHPTRTPIGDYLSHLIRGADVPLLLVDGAGSIVVASDGFHRLVGRNRLSARPWSEFVAPRDWTRVGAATLDGTSVECDLVGAASTIRVALEFIPLAHPALRGAGTLVIGHDLTALRNLERQVIQAEKLATLGQLAAGVVHELNNPLTSILAYSAHMHDIATKDSRPPKEVEALRRIVESSERMKRFTKSLVAYARPATGYPTRVDVAGLIDEAVGFCEHLIRHLDTRVQIDLPEGFSGARGVRASLQQVLINLITNACHAAPQNGQLRITAAVDGEEVIICVIDNGPGVPAALRNEIFEPFFSTKAEGDGTGLGLSIVRNILSLQSASIKLDETYEGGACFVVRLPTWHDQVSESSSVPDRDHERRTP